MKKSFRYLTCLCLSAMTLFSCGESKEEKENTELPPAEETEVSDEIETPVLVTNNYADPRIVFTLNEVGETDTAATMISGYIEADHAPVELKKMKLLLHTKPLNAASTKGQYDYMMKVEEDGRVPGVWVSQNSNCSFSLIAAKDTFRFSAPVGKAIYRFKLQFKAKS